MTTAIPATGGAAYAGNNVYGNAAFNGAIAGMLQGRAPIGAGVSLSAANIAAARAFAVEVDALITPVDAQVTTNAAVTELLADTSNTIQANTFVKPFCLAMICFGLWSGRNGSDATAADYAALAANAVASFVLAVAQLTTP